MVPYSPHYAASWTMPSIGTNIAQPQRWEQHLRTPILGMIRSSLERTKEGKQRVIRFVNARMAVMGCGLGEHLLLHL